MSRLQIIILWQASQFFERRSTRSRPSLENESLGFPRQILAYRVRGCPFRQLNISTPMLGFIPNSVRPGTFGKATPGTIQRWHSEDEHVTDWSQFTFAIADPKPQMKMAVIIVLARKIWHRYSWLMRPRGNLRRIFRLFGIVSDPGTFRSNYFPRKLLIRAIMIDFPGAADETVDRGILAGHFGIPQPSSVMTLWITGVRMFRVGFRRSFVCSGHVALIVVTQ